MTSAEQPGRGGPLAGMKVLEFAGIGPAPMGAMMLADMGAEVLTIDRVEAVELGSPRTPGF
ncbi:MAG: CoA transferase, partial [Acetobacteraceae bacterium]